jgi:hypothetical protein
MEKHSRSHALEEKLAARGASDYEKLVLLKRLCEELEVQNHTLRLEVMALKQRLTEAVSIARQGRYKGIDFVAVGARLDAMDAYASDVNHPQDLPSGPVEISEVLWEYEDNLPDLICSDFKSLFLASRVDVVRMYPYVKDSKGGRIWIKSLPPTVYASPQHDEPNTPYLASNSLPLRIEQPYEIQPNDIWYFQTFVSHSGAVGGCHIPKTEVERRLEAKVGPGKLVQIEGVWYWDQPTRQITDPVTSTAGMTP